MSALLALPLLGAILRAANDPAAAVDPFIGVDGGGNVCVTSALPFSLVRLGPDTAPPQPTNGYTTGRPVIGFSHTHTSGTGGGGHYGNVLVSPETGALDLRDPGSPITGERAEPGYYRTTLTRWGVTAELTQGARFGVHRYTFARAGGARLLVSASSHRTRGRREMQCLGARVQIVSDRRLEGEGTFAGGWGNHATSRVYFAAETDRPFSARVWAGGAVKPGPAAGGTDCGAVLDFELKPGDRVELRVGLSFLNLTQARAELARARSAGFEATRGAARAEWNRALDRIAIDGGTAAERTLFYTALYHALLMPTDVTGATPGWPADAPQFWDFYTLWDTFRTVNPLFTLIQPEQEARIVRCLTAIGAKKGWVPDAWISGDYATEQGGTNGDVVIADAIVKHLPGIDADAAYAAIRRDAVDPGGDGLYRGRYLAPYLKLGYLPATTVDERNAMPCPVSRTLEYAYDDYCLALAAETLGRHDDAVRFKRQSLYAWNLFDPQYRLFWARDAAGRWLDGFVPNRHIRSWKGPYYEGTAEQYAFSVPQDIAGLVRRDGGATAFTTALDHLFDAQWYNPTNEPDIIVPWLYDYVGRPDRVAERVHALMRAHYTTGRQGLPGNDDAGTLSAWYVFGALGFYPCAGQDVYLLGSPSFAQTTLDLGHGRLLTIDAPGLSETNRYVQSVTLNGRTWAKTWFRHRDIAGGGTLVFTMGPAPATRGADEPPPSQ
ncbi:MAG TPA: GH92 family glycosyl hydrolase [Opitutaceae bacterium]|nr:GH92 family glycosyl hydrolase [Opitutaceae bacterium]